MILFFSYFWVATQFNEIQIADDLKKYGGYIPGVRPGQATSDYLHNAMSRSTLAGAVFLTVIATIPILLNQALGVPFPVATFFGAPVSSSGQGDARYDAPDGIASLDAPMRRLPQGAVGALLVPMPRWLKPKIVSKPSKTCPNAAGLRDRSTVLDEVCEFIQPGI
jgi:hypothetical protein